MYNKLLQLIDKKAFDCEYSIGCIDPHALYEPTDSLKHLLELYEFDPSDWKYSREDSKIDEHQECIYSRIEFINPNTKEALVFTWESKE